MLRILKSPARCSSLSVRRWYHQTKNVFSSTEQSYEVEEKTSKDLRRNEINIQMLPNNLHQTIFKDSPNSLSGSNDMKEIEEHLTQHDLWDRPPEILKDIDFSLPQLSGNNIEEHFRNIASEQTEDIKQIVQTFLNSEIPEKPKTWNFAKGWTKYDKNGEATLVDYPDEEILIFDIECLVKEGSYPTMASALSPTHWYSWCSEYLIEKKFRWSTELTLTDLIPLETKKGSVSINNKSKKIIIGHNVGFDRSFIKEQYLIQNKKTCFLDTMSLHIAICGLTSFQRILFNAGKDSHRKEVLEFEKKLRQRYVEHSTDWMSVGTMNSLNAVYQFHCKDSKPLEKEKRNTFVVGTMSDVRDDFQDLLNYCAHDVSATHSVFSKLWPEFLERFPHPVTLAGMIEMGTAYLPINANWERYITLSNAMYDEIQTELKKMLMELANETCEMLEGERYKNDPWLWDLDWSVSDYKLNKSGNENDVPKEDLLEILETDDKEEVERKTLINKVISSKCRIPKRPVYMAGYPVWYKDLCPKPKDEDWQPGPSLISTQMRVVPKLLRLTWDGYPLHFHVDHGWGYLVPGHEESELEKELKKMSTEPIDEVYFPLKNLKEFVRKSKSLDKRRNSKANVKEILNDVDVDSMEPEEKSVHWRAMKGEQPIPDFVFSNLLKQHKGNGPFDIGIPGCLFYRIPHKVRYNVLVNKNGAQNKVGNPLAKDYMNRIEDGTLRAATGDQAQRILYLGKICSYWKNNQERIEKQMSVWLKKSELPKTVTKEEDYDPDSQYGGIIPRIVTAGTVTRRAVERTWLTASNAYEDRIGSELKAMIQAPPGYCFVGADVDSQELWIASILGDAYFKKVHGCTAFGWMTLQGKKQDKTDLHSKTAETASISRDHAKVLNYGRIYGAGQKFAEKLLMQFNPKLTPEEARKKAMKMFISTKGKRNQYRKWFGGSESDMFNALEMIARLHEPKTPVLGCRISKTLEPHNVLEDFMTSRVNWVVQSSAVDYLHLMLVCMRWLFDKYNINGRFSISLHDEVRYMVCNEDKYRAALALQITNLLTRSMFAYKLDMNDLPQSVAFFSAVDIDQCLRKEVTMDCVTPSNIHGLSKGYNIPPGMALDIYEILEITQGSLLKPVSAKDKNNDSDSENNCDSEEAVQG
ncbi:hypothetical protein LOTGIDRAFT_239325 [Lottia gigantea]|uniref:DNA polymerase subunit gamma-1 n=1 Tax=Lottia gigantea TaxID=225164 RepID=V4ARN8_LOTGI|nr:hypothetical protein LOTGIDRAFT_239325 [Lottia gigantea]ESO96346.1 hypothetical protein LOTGIDRAFT_239325 [Lottia gigantea]